MVYSYTPTYYSSIHDTITSLCKTILPFNFKKPRLTAADQKLSKKQSENLKWQQESFHRILNLIGLHKEGMVPESEVSAFRSHLLDTLIASPADQEQPTVTRDKLLFLQELFYAKCISIDEYHSSKRPLLQRLAIQGAEIEARDVIIASKPTDNSEEEEWSEINFKDEDSLVDRDSLNPNKAKQKTPLKRIKGAASMIGFVSKSRGKQGISENIDPNMPSNVNEFSASRENPFWGVSKESKSILISHASPPRSVPVEKEKGSTEKVKKKALTLFQREGKGGENFPDPEDRSSKSAKKQWGFDGFKKWKRNISESEEAPLPFGERSDDQVSSAQCHLVSSPIGEGPDTKLIKKKIHSDGSASDFFIDKVLGDNIKKELSRIQTELDTKNSNLQFSSDQIEAISTRLPVDKADLKKFFPRSWCDRYGDIVLDVVKKEFKDHVGEMETLRNTTKDRHSNSATWVTFEDDNTNENSHPNLFVNCDQSSAFISNCFINEHGESNGDKLNSESPYSQDYNPFWSPGNASSMRG